MSNRIFFFAVPSMVALVVGGISLGAVAATMSRAERVDHERQITADFRADQARCEKLGGAQKNACAERARGNERLARAELAYNATGSQTDAGRLAVARSDADYAFAKERCDARKGDVREACFRDAKAAHARSTNASR